MKKGERQGDDYFLEFKMLLKFLTTRINQKIIEIELGNNTSSWLKK